MSPLASSDTAAIQAPAQGLVAQPDITSRGAFSRSHLYNLIKRGHFPKPALVCGPRFTRWSAHEVDRWFADPAAWIAAHAPAEVQP